MLAWLLDLVLHLDSHLVELLARYDLWIYPILFAVIFAETGLVVTPFLPGDSLLFVAGAVAASGQFRLDLLVLSVLVGAVLGNLMNFWLGTWLGHKVFDGNVRWIDRASLEKTRAFFDRHGGKTVTVAFFVPLVRSFAPLVAGAMSMNPGKFNLYSVLGGLAWVGIFIGAGFFFGNLPLVRDHLGMVLILGIVAALIGPFLAAATWRLVNGRLRALRGS